MGITFANYGQERELNLNEYETKIASKLTTIMQGHNVEVVRKSPNYVTLVRRADDIINHDINLAEFKYTDKTKWIKIAISNEDREYNLNNPLFGSETNKNAIMWKSELTSIDDVVKYKTFFDSTIEMWKNL